MSLMRTWGEIRLGSGFQLLGEEIWKAVLVVFEADIRHKTLQEKVLGFLTPGKKGQKMCWQLKCVFYLGKKGVKITSLWEPEACTAGKMTYVTDHDDVPSFWVSQGVNMQRVEAKKVPSAMAHTLPSLSFLHLPFSCYVKEHLLLRLIFRTKSVTFKTLILALFPEVDNFLTKNFISVSHLNVRGLSFPRTSTESRKRNENSYFQRCFFWCYYR